MQSSCDVKSLTYCDLQCILLNKLKDTLVQYPEFAETFHEEIKHDLTYNLKEGFDESEVRKGKIKTCLSHQARMTQLYLQKFYRFCKISELVKSREMPSQYSKNYENIRVNICLIWTLANRGSAIKSLPPDIVCWEV